MENIRLTEIRFAASSDAERRTGLLGWVSATLNGALRLDGLALRRTADGRLTVSFPAKRDGSGRQHHYVRPIDDASRREIERQLVEAVRFGDYEEHTASRELGA